VVAMVTETLYGPRS